jgi:hypothetical protein
MFIDVCWDLTEATALVLCLFITMYRICECLLRKCIYNFTKRIEQSNNELIMLLRSNSRVRTGPMWSHWTKVLYTC